MMKYIKLGLGLLLLAGLISSCSRKVCPPSSVIVRDSIVYKDTIIKIDPIPVSIKGDSAKLKDTIAELPRDLEAEKKVTTGKTTASYKIKDRIITVDCDVAPYEDTIRDLKAKLQTKESYQSKETTLVKEVEVVKYKTPGWIKILLAVEVLGIFIWAWTKGYLGTALGFLTKLFKK